MSFRKVVEDYRGYVDEASLPGAAADKRPHSDFKAVRHRRAEVEWAFDLRRGPELFGAHSADLEPRRTMRYTFREPCGRLQRKPRRHWPAAGGARRVQPAGGDRMSHHLVLRFVWIQSVVSPLRGLPLLRSAASIHRGARHRAVGVRLSASGAVGCEV